MEKVVTIQSEWTARGSMTVAYTDEQRRRQTIEIATITIELGELIARDRVGNIVAKLGIPQRTEV